jgi:hypothetical protein
MRKKILSMGILSSLALFLLFGICLNSFAEYNKGDIISNFTLNDLNGNPVSLYDYTGYAILLYFTAAN